MGLGMFVVIYCVEMKRRSGTVASSSGGGLWIVVDFRERGKCWRTASGEDIPCIDR
jgi:predicted type IV restriction endonuclease